MKAVPAGGDGLKGPAPHVLIVEDNEVNRILTEQILERLEVSYATTVNGELAVRHFVDHPPGIILMDISMPVMDGYRATERIREIEAERRLKRTPIIGLTAHAMEGDREKCLEAGMDDYLTKPVSTARLAEALAKWRTGADTSPTADSLAAQ